MGRAKPYSKRPLIQEYKLAVKALKERVRQLRKKGTYIPEIEVQQYSLSYIGKENISEALIEEVKSQYRKDVLRGLIVDPETGELVSKSDYESIKKHRNVVEQNETPKTELEQRRERDLEQFRRAEEARNRAKIERKYKRSKKRINNALDEAVEQSARYPHFSEMVLSRVSNQINKFPTANGFMALTEFVDRMREHFGDYKTALMFQAAASEGLEIDWPMMYQGNYQIFINQLIKFMPDVDAEDAEMLNDVIEEISGWEQLDED